MPINTKEAYMQQQLKILLMGDASNFHASLATALREMGHSVTVVSNGSKWMDTRRDLTLSRRPGKTGAIKYVFDIARMLPRLKGFDIVHLINPIFLELRPGKVKLVFDYLKRNNRHIYLSAIGTDYIYVQACMNGDIFKYSDFKIGNNPSPYMLSQESKEHRVENWGLPVMKHYSDYVTPKFDGVMTCLYEYYKAYEGIIPAGRLAYGGIPIETRSIKPNLITRTPEKIKFFLGRHKHRTVLKGTDLMLEALRRTCDRYPGLCEMQVVENRPYDEYIELLSSAHVNLDQLYSYTPATNALLGMARGVVAVSGAEPEFYDFIDEHDCRPIINVSPLVEGDIDHKLAWIVEHRDRLPELSRMSREFVEKHNDSHIVAQKHLDFWQKTASTHNS